MNMERGPVPIRDDFLAFGRPNFSEEEIEAVARVLRSGWIGMGAETIAFERELAEFVQAPYVVSVSSCTAALHLSLVALGVGPGDEVICPSLTWCSTANAALYVGAKPVLCDVDADTLSVTPETIAACITPRTKAVMVVHMGGLACDVRRLRATLPEHIAIVEDAAHALGARYPDGSPVGSSGNLVCFSFYANKNLSTAEGGAVAATDASLVEVLRSIRQHGLSSDAWKRYIEPTKAIVPGVARLGYKANFTDLQACIGRVQLRRQHEFRRIRARVAERYRATLAEAGVHVRFQSESFGPKHARHLLIVKLPVETLRVSRNQLVLALRERNIGASIHYTPLHAMTFYSQYALELPVTDWLAARILTLPIGPSMSEEDVDYVAAHMAELMRGQK
jgi:dTDP-4-amino-4,6-dideoxygalactose transaminase